MSKVSTPIIADASNLSDSVLGRVVDQWCGAISDKFELAADKMQTMQSCSSDSIGANEKSQKNWVSNVKKEFGTTLLSCSTKYGNRAKYRFQFNVLDAAKFSQHMKGENNERYKLCESNAAWFVSHVLKRNGINNKIERKQMTFCVFSRHASIRTIQRANVKNLEDYTEMLRSIHYKIIALHELSFNFTSEHQKYYRIPVKVPNQDVPVVMVLTDVGMGQNAHVTPFVKTILPSQTFTKSMWLQTLYTYMEGKKDQDLFSFENVEQTMFLLEKNRTSDLPDARY